MTDGVHDNPVGLRESIAAAMASALASAKRTVRIERSALDALGSALDDSDLGEAFGIAARMIVAGTSRVIVTGIGKSGIIGRKLAATLTSTGTPAMFLHPSEASHGDLGMVTANDIVIALSWSGETRELSDVVAYSRRFKVSLIAITANSTSTLAKQATIALVLPSVEEACPNNLAPTSSSLIQAALGDALAVALIELRGFSPDEFRQFHPRGQLGAQLLRLCDVMSTGDEVPAVKRTATLLDAMLEMTRARLGVTAIVDDDRKLIGAFTDGDLRRVMTQAGIDAPIAKYMTADPVWVSDDILASEAISLMNELKISQLFACTGGRLIGIVHLHDLLRFGVM